MATATFTVPAEGQLKAALIDFQQTTADVANYFQQLWDEGSIRDGLDDDEIQEVRDLILRRCRAQEEMLEAIQNHPAALMNPQFLEVL